MAAIFDIMASFIIGGLLVLMTLTAVSSGVTQFFNYNSDAIAQTNLTETADIIEYDLRKVGFAIPEIMKDSILIIAWPNRLKYISHLNYFTDHVVDTVEYFIQPADTIQYPDTSLIVYDVIRVSEISGFPLDSGSVGRIANDSIFVYLDQVGDPATLIKTIKMVEVTLIAFTPELVLSDEILKLQGDERREEFERLMRESYWRQTRVLSRNLKR
jgi:hypothetical protein